MVGKGTKDSVQSREKTAPIRILLVEHHDLIRDSLRALLHTDSGIKVVGEARNRAEVLDALHLHPDVVLLELDLGPDNGLDVLDSVSKLTSRPRVLIVTASQNRDRHIEAACKGAMGIVMKQDGATELLKAILTVHSGDVWMDRTMMAEAMAHLRQKPVVLPRDPDSPKIDALTTRERSVIALLGEGLRNKQIGERLSISEKTVRHHMTSIFNKLRVKDRHELMIFAYQRGLARLPARGNG